METVSDEIGRVACGYGLSLLGGPVESRLMSPSSLLRKCNGWSQFREELARLTKKEKGDCFELLTWHFLQLHPKYATKLKGVFLRRDLPISVAQKLNLPATDEGIDLIALTKENEYWAIQCKYVHDETASLTRKELSTFTDLAFSICRGISLALVCTTADRHSHKLHLHGERVTFCAGDVWRDLDREFFRRLHNALGERPSPPKACEPRPHQARAITRAVEHFVEGRNRRGKMIQPCGTGKTLTAYWIAEALKASKVFVAVPSLALIRQILESWTHEMAASQSSANWMCVCSDETVSVERDDAIVLTQDLGIRVHTDPDEISLWLQKAQGCVYVFTTYQSGPALAAGARKAKARFDLGIFDEAHRTVGQHGGIFGHLLHDQNILVSKRLFMTATERRYRGESDEVLSMDDPETYGDTFELLSFREALEARPPILSDYRVITINVSHDEIRDLVRSNVLVCPDRGSWNGEIEARTLAAIVALRKAICRVGISHVVSFHQSIARAQAFRESQERFTDAFPRYGPLQTFHVSGRTPTAVRQRTLELFVANRPSLVTNARCLTEGVDVPAIDCVVFGDPRKSTIDLVQAVGRTLRPAKGKALGYIVVPVLLDRDGTLCEGGEQFEALLTLLRQLASNDERIVFCSTEITEVGVR